MRRVVMDGTREFASVRDAAKHIIASGAGKLNTVTSNISHVATQGHGTAYGHVWSYKDDKRDLVDVVRCRDCENYDSERDGCWWFAHAERQPDYSWADEPSDVEPDGFCAWACRKEGGDD